MKYAINQIVKVLETNQIKVISDYENIEGVKIYYMTDNSAFAESQLQEHSLEELIIEKKEIDMIIISLKKIVSEERKTQIERCEKYMEKYFSDIKKQEILLEETKTKLKKEKWNKLFNKLKKFFLLK